MLVLHVKITGVQFDCAICAVNINRNVCMLIGADSYPQKSGSRKGVQEDQGCWWLPMCKTWWRSTRRMVETL